LQHESEDVGGVPIVDVDDVLAREVAYLLGAIRRPAFRLGQGVERYSPR
jgi:hypothetical protein